MKNIDFGSVGILQIGGERFGFRPLEVYQEYDAAPIMKGEVLTDVFEASNLQAKSFKGLKHVEKRAVPPIENVIFNDPATVVIWGDGTKTVVKCQEGDVYSKELGLAMCISKKVLGNQGNYNEVFKTWIPEEPEPVEYDGFKIGDLVTVTEPELAYPDYKYWLDEYVRNPLDVLKWKKYASRPKKGDIGVVKTIAPHGIVPDTLAYVEIHNSGFIMSLKGLKRVK